MCSPSFDAKQPSKAELKRGTKLGAVSLALLFIATSLTMPHQQDRRDELGCDSMCFGSMNSLKSFLTLVGAASIGRASDMPGMEAYGGARKLLLLVGILATAVGVIQANQARTVSHLWMSVLPAALQQNMSVMKALFSDYHDLLESSTAERAGSIGSIGMAAGVSMMIGPLTGSVVLKTYNQAAVGSVCCLIVSGVLVYLMPSVSPQEPATSRETPQSGRWSLKSVKSPAALFFLVARLLATLSHHIYQTLWTVSMRNRLNFQPRDYGIFMSVIGFCFAVSQGFLAKQILKTFGSSPRGRVYLLTGCIFISGMNRLLAFQTVYVPFIYFLFATMVLALGVTATVFATDTSQIATPEERGTFFGLIQAVESGAGMIGPIISGALTFYHPKGPLVAVVTLNCLSFALFAFGYERVVLGPTQSMTTAKKKD